MGDERAATAAGIGAARVLVADDDPPLRRMLKRSLTADGFEVTVAADGPAALLEAERSAPDVIVLDVAMPAIDGLSVCRRLRDRGLVTPILMLTARDAVADRVAGLEAGADDYLVKPFAIEELVARLRALTRRGRDERSLLSYADLTLDTEARAASRGEPHDRADRPRGGAAGDAAGASRPRGHPRARAGSDLGRRGRGQRRRPLRDATAAKARRAGRGWIRTRARLGARLRRSSATAVDPDAARLRVRAAGVTAVAADNHPMGPIATLSAGRRARCERG